MATLPWVGQALGQGVLEGLRAGVGVLWGLEEHGFGLDVDGFDLAASCWLGDLASGALTATRLTFPVV